MARPKSNGSSKVSTATIGFEATVRFLGVWDRLSNPDFKPLEFERFRNEAGRNDFSVGQKMNHPDWVRRVQN